MIAIAGNKSDLEEKREVQASQAKAYADEIGALFIETSAKEDTNVSDLFISISTLKYFSCPPALTMLLLGKKLPSALDDHDALPEIVDPYGNGRKKGGCC